MKGLLLSVWLAGTGSMPALAGSDADFAAALSEARGAAKAATNEAKRELEAARRPPEAGRAVKELVELCDLAGFRGEVAAGLTPTAVFYEYAVFPPDLNGETEVVVTCHSMLEYAVMRSCEGIVRELTADPRVDPNEACNHPPLVRAAAIGDEKVVDVLLAHPRLQVDRAGSDGQTALMAAAREGRSGIVEKLLDRGADPSRMDKDHRRAEDHASDAGHAALDGWLRKNHPHEESDEDVRRFRALPPSTGDKDSWYAVSGGMPHPLARTGRFAPEREWQWGFWKGTSVGLEFLGIATGELPVAPKNAVPGAETRESFVAGLLAGHIRHRFLRLGWGDARGKGFFLQPYATLGYNPLLVQFVDRKIAAGKFENVETKMQPSFHVEAGIEASTGGPVKVGVDYRRYLIDPVPQPSDFIGARVTLTR